MDENRCSGWRDELLAHMPVQTSGEFLYDGDVVFAPQGVFLTVISAMHYAGGVTPFFSAGALAIADIVHEAFASSLDQYTPAEIPGPYWLLGQLSKESPIMLRGAANDVSAAAGAELLSTLRVLPPEDVADGTFLVLEDGLVYRVEGGRLTGLSANRNAIYHGQGVNEYIIRRDQEQIPLTALR